jgi:hypothetical protein
MSPDPRWELGSEFHWQGLPVGPFLAWPKPVVWYLLGRHALLALLKHLGGSRNLWLPSYFCHEVAQPWAVHVRLLRYYEDDPTRLNPEWETLMPAPDDIVLAVNYFGMRAGEPWTRWRRGHKCVLVEDHTHDPHSSWARSSRADYAFCSLRKLFPVPDGAILWSPTRRPLPTAPEVPCDSGSSAKLTAMLFKTDYLAGRGTRALKENFRRLQLSGEVQMEAVSVSAASPFTCVSLAAGVPRRWRKMRRSNALCLARALAGWEVAQSLFLRVPQGSAPFGVVLVFASPAARDWHRENLRQHNIYCPIHWLASPAAGVASHDLAAQILTIPCDQRYTIADMERVGAILRQGKCRV